MVCIFELNLLSTFINYRCVYFYQHLSIIDVCIFRLIKCYVDVTHVILTNDIDKHTIVEYILLENGLLVAFCLFLQCDITLRNPFSQSKSMIVHIYVLHVKNICIIRS